MPKINKRFEYINNEVFLDTKKQKPKTISIIPSIVILGAQKSATTSLANYLDMHPEVFMTKPMKESGYFLPIESVQRSLLNQGFPVHSRKEAIIKYCYKEYNAEKHILDASTYYTLSPKERRKTAISALKKAQEKQEIKYIYIIRNPYYRMISAYFHFLRRPSNRNALRMKFIEQFVLRNSRFMEKPFKKVYRSFKKLRRKTSWKKKGNNNKLNFDEFLNQSQNAIVASSYASVLQEYANSLDPFDCKIVFFENLIQRPQKVLSNLHEFLELDEYEHEHFEKHNPGITNLKDSNLNLSEDTKNRVVTKIEKEKKLLQEKYPHLSFPDKFMEVPNVFTE